MTSSDWFNQARYGMFIHWGAYSVAARGEWTLNRERIPFDEYTAKYVQNFRAENYDPGAWARLAREGGMKYVVLTTRHHDGFALWDTKANDFNAARLGPGRDLLLGYVEALRGEGLKVGFYYSVADWRHPDYPGAYERDWPTGWTDEAARQRFVAYYRAQLEELMTGYGKIDILWYDGGIPGPLDGAEVNARVRELQPDIMINNRNGDPGHDFHCCEQTVKPAEPGKNWEACMTLNSNWGYHAGDSSWKSPKDVVKLLGETAAGAGNLLINVGPRADGSIPEESGRIIREVGKWLEKNGEFLAGSDRSPFSWLHSGRLTTRGNIAYLHLFYGCGTEYCVADFRNRVLSARLVATGEPVSFRQGPDRLFLEGIPDPLPDPLDTIIALEMDGTPEPLTERTTFWIPE